jgi:hypothetical protein
MLLFSLISLSSHRRRRGVAAIIVGCFAAFVAVFTIGVVFKMIIVNVTSYKKNVNLILY